MAVRVKEHRSQWITMVGEVVRPGKYFLQGSKTLLELLTEAGGFTPHASGEVVVSRPDGSAHPEEDNGGSGSVRILLSPDQPTAQQKAALSLQLGNGDIVTATVDAVLLRFGGGEEPRKLSDHAGPHRTESGLRRGRSH